MKSRTRFPQFSRRGLLASGAAIAAISTVAPVALPNIAAAAPQTKASPEQLKQMVEFVTGLAQQAAIYAAPLVAMYLLRQSVSFGDKPKAAPGEIWRIADITTPAIAEQAGYTTPNVNVVYGFGFIDLGVEPVVLTVPDSNDRYYMVEIVDMWTNAFAYAGGVATGYKGGKFALVGPGWKGDLPEGVTRIQSPTRWVEVQPRVHVVGEADLPEAEKVLKAITVQGLSAFNGKTPPAAPKYDYPTARINPKVASSKMEFDDPLEFWAIFSNALNENPPPQSEIESVLPQFALLGIELGKPWKAESVAPEIVEIMRKVAADIGAMSTGILPLLGRVANGWIIPPANMGMAGADYPTRAAVAVFGLTANTVTEAIYYSGILDGDGKPMTGDRKYTIDFKEPMHYLEPLPPSFWSLTMYDGVTQLTAPNPINRYSLGSDNPIKKNADGSFTLYIQHDDPGPEKESNWLPAPAGPFYLILRNYAPVPEAAEGLKSPATFVGPPPVVPVK